jgi:hypothetical protein
MIRIHAAPSPPAEEATAREEQARQASTDDGTGNSSVTDGQA